MVRFLAIFENHPWAISPIGFFFLNAIVPQNIGLSSCLTVVISLPQMRVFHLLIDILVRPHGLR